MDAAGGADPENPQGRPEEEIAGGADSKHPPGGGAGSNNPTGGAGGADRNNCTAELADPQPGSRLQTLAYVPLLQQIANSATELNTSLEFAASYAEKTARFTEALIILLLAILRMFGRATEVLQSRHLGQETLKKLAILSGAVATMASGLKGVADLGVELMDPNGASSSSAPTASLSTHPLNAASTPPPDAVSSSSTTPATPPPSSAPAIATPSSTPSFDDENEETEQ